MDSRLDRFRTYFERLDPESRPSTLLSEDRYAEPPGRATGEQLASRLQLAPWSNHLVTGPIGTGKTTQLHRAAKTLNAGGDTKAVYIDVSQHHDLDRNLAGVMVVLAGLALAKAVGKNPDDDVRAAHESFRRWAHGHREFIPYDPRDDEDDYGPDEEPGHWEHHPGVIAPPLPPLTLDSKERVNALKTLKKALPDGVSHFVVLFDSLDRLDDVEAFRRAVTDDIRALKQAGIGVVVVSPMRLLYGSNRPIIDIFDQVHIVPALDVTQPKERDFLLRVLAKRTDESVVGPEVREQLIDVSGGLLRDLLQLTRSSVEEAFVVGADAVAPDHVARAVDEFGRTMIFGLRMNEIDTLDGLRRFRAFVPTSDDDIALLASRRVIEYHGIVKRYAVHPAIEPLLASLRRIK
ncbi:MULTISPECIES: ATP-binding protein [Sorangium]|uniref:ATP-binding protein n=1 Tax=Sorangium TaxID=39643 RepID=UPI00101A0BAD|nr:MULTISPECIES: ATP-binding protein [Sorangium]